MKLFYRKYGEGPPLIILHGLYGSSDNWATIAKQISDIYTVYLPDMRNHGQSPHSEIHDYDSMRDDLSELANYLKLDRFFLAGHSMGGKAAISFALKWPEKLYGLMIADISPFTNEITNQAAYKEHLTILKAILSIDLAGISGREDVKRLLTDKIASERTIEFIMKNLRRNTGNNFGWKINPVSLLNNLDKIMDGIDRKEYLSQHITGFPVIFLKGAESEYLPESDFSDIRKVFPAAEFVTVPEAGHWVHADNPEKVIKNLRRLRE